MIEKGQATPGQRLWYWNGDPWQTPQEAVFIRHYKKRVKVLLNLRRINITAGREPRYFDNTVEGLVPATHLYIDRPNGNSDE